MKSFVLAYLAGTALAARPWLYAPDTGADTRYAELGVEPGELPPLEDILCLNDFEWAARNVLNSTVLAGTASGAGTEGSYRMNTEAFQQYRFRPRTMVDILSVNETFRTSILGHDVALPFFITAFGRADIVHEQGELNLVRAAADQGMLYVVSMSASRGQDEIGNATAEGQVYFQQLYKRPGWDDERLRAYLDNVKRYGGKAIFFTVDSAGDGDRVRGARWGVGSSDNEPTQITWEYYEKLRSMTNLPIVFKGISTVEDAKAAIEHGVDGIYLSNHGARQLDGAPSGYEQAPEIFQQIEVYADGGVRSGADILKLLALGVRAVGLGRPFLFANLYGEEGVIHAAKILKRELLVNSQNLGLADLRDINANYITKRMFPPL